MTDEIAPRSAVNQMTLDPQGHPMVPRDPDGEAGSLDYRLAQVRQPRYRSASPSTRSGWKHQRPDGRGSRRQISPHPLTPDSDVLPIVATVSAKRHEGIE